MSEDRFRRAIEAVYSLRDLQSKLTVNQARMTIAQEEFKNACISGDSSAESRSAEVLVSLYSESLTILSAILRLERESRG